MTTQEFTEFYTEWYPQMVKYFGWKVRDGEDPEDLAQTLFTDFAHYPERLRLESARRYMWVSARHLATKARHDAFLMPMTYDPIPDALDERGSQLARRIEASSAVKDRTQAVVDRDAIIEELKGLRPQERDVIQATTLNGETLAAYCARANLTEAWGWSLRRTGLDRLRWARWQS